MWIRTITLKNFRSYVSSSLELSKGVNLIVGKNNSGKSVLLKSVAWLQNNSAGISAQDIRKLKQDGSIEIHLEDSGKYFNIQTDLQTKIKADLSNQINEPPYAWHYESVPVSSDFIDDSEAYHPISNDGQVYQTISNYEPNNFIYPYLSKRKVTGFDESINSQKTMSVNGNFLFLPAKVDRLSNPEIPANKEYIESCDEIIGFRISAVPSANGKKAAQVIDNFENISLEEMGEGIANLLGLIVDLCMAEDKLFLIEELENDIHPKALKKLLELIEKKSKTNQFIITTHSNIVVKYLGSLPDSKLFQVTMEHMERIPTSNVEEIKNSPEDRLLVLNDLGYDLFDFDIWSGWLFLEESSAERIIREYLIPWFAPKLVNRLRTVAAEGKDDIKVKFQDFKRLFLFVHLEPIYVNSAWVVIDSGNEEKIIIENLQNDFPSWDKNHFRQFSEHDFERYYPKEFKPDLQGEIDKILMLKNTKEKRTRKRAILNELITWIKVNENVAKNAFQESASEVIEILKDIENSINK